MESVKQPLELMKAFGSRLKTNQLRMNTIKGRLEIMSNQVENVEELKEAPTTSQADAFLMENTNDGSLKKKDYEATDDDEVDQLVKKFLSTRAVEVVITRLQAGVYQVADKTLPMQIKSDNEAILEVRVGSTWIKLEDHLNNLQHRDT